MLLNAEDALADVEAAGASGPRRPRFEMRAEAKQKKQAEEKGQMRQNEQGLRLNVPPSVMELRGVGSWIAAEPTPLAPACSNTLSPASNAPKR